MNSRGSVLIFVLIFIAFSASTVLLIHERSTKSLVETTDDFYENQAHIYAMTALAAAMESLTDDDNAYDTKRENWALVPVVEIPYGFISVDITPTNAKISLNNMADGNEKIAARHLDACNNLAAELDTDELKCGVIKDYLDSDKEVSDEGEEGYTYERNGALFTTKNEPLTSLYELRLLMNSSEQFAKVTDHLTVYNPEKALNINFASADSLKALLPEIAEYADDIINYAKTKDFKDPSNILEAADIPQDIYQQILPYIAVKSSLFYVKTEVTLNDEPRYYHALILKDGSNAEVVNFLAGINGQYY